MMVMKFILANGVAGPDSCGRLINWNTISVSICFSEMYLKIFWKAIAVLGPNPLKGLPNFGTTPLVNNGTEKNISLF